MPLGNSSARALAMRTRLRSKAQSICFVAASMLATGVPAHAAPPVLLANVLSERIDPAAYLVSEKYDGVRAIWDGKTLRFRSGRTVSAPDWFIARLPAEKLDGELWLNRGGFERLSGFVRKSSSVDAEWRQIKYMVFELPDATGTFADRYAQLRGIVAKVNWSQLLAVEQFSVADRAALKRRLDQIVKAGGEGLMLHLADAPYVTGRSDVLLKLKPLLDTEATVVAHLAGKGKYAGQMGALRLEMPDGTRFNIGTGFSDAVRKAPPPLGAIVTYTYRGLTSKGTPRFASYLRVREEF
jgi:DNA ligase-1